MKNILCTILLFFAINASSNAFYKTLSDSEVREAIDYGQKNKKTEWVTFIKPWVRENVRNERGGTKIETCTMFTNFFLLAAASRRAAQKYQFLDPDSVIHENETGGKNTLDIYVVFSFFLLGNKMSSSKDLHSVIQFNSTIIQPVSKVNDNYATKYVASGSHIYRLEDIPANKIIKVIAIKSTGEEIIFKFDLSQIK